MKKNIKILIIGCICIIVCVAIVLIGFQINKVGKINNYLSTAQRYIEELDYEQAIVNLKLALEINPHSKEIIDRIVDTYFMMAEEGINSAEYEEVIIRLEECFALTQTETVKLKIEEIQQLQQIEVERLQEEMNKKKEMEEKKKEEERKKQEEKQEIDQETEAEEKIEEVDKEEFNRQESETVEGEITNGITTESVDVAKGETWIDELYNNTVNNNYIAVLNEMVTSDFVERCQPYEIDGWALNPGEAAYQLTTSVGSHAVVVIYSSGEKSIIVCNHAEDSYGLDCTSYGDHQVTVHPDGSYDWFDGNFIHYSNGSEPYEIKEGEVYSVWHM